MFKSKKKSKTNTKLKTNKQTKTYRILSFLGTETQFLLEIDFRPIHDKNMKNRV